MEREAGVGDAGDGPGAVGGHVVQAEQRPDRRPGRVEGGAGEDDRLVPGNHPGGISDNSYMAFAVPSVFDFFFNYNELIN